MFYNMPCTLRIHRDTTAADFVPREDASEYWNSIVAAGKTEEFWNFLTYEFPHGCEWDELNNFIVEEVEYYNNRIGIIDKEKRDNLISSMVECGLYLVDEYFDEDYYVLCFEIGDDTNLLPSDYFEMGDGKIVFCGWNNVEAWLEEEVDMDQRSRNRVVSYQQSAASGQNPKTRDQNPETAERPAKTEKVEMREANNLFYRWQDCGQHFHRTIWAANGYYCPDCGAKLEWE